MTNHLREMETLKGPTESHVSKGLQEISRGGAKARSVVLVDVHLQKDEEKPQSDLLSKSLLINQLNPPPVVQSSASPRLCGMLFAWMNRTVSFVIVRMVLTRCLGHKRYFLSSVPLNKIQAFNLSTTRISGIDGKPMQQANRHPYHSQMRAVALFIAMRHIAKIHSSIILLCLSFHLDLARQT